MSKRHFSVKIVSQQNKKPSHLKNANYAVCFPKYCLSWQTKTKKSWLCIKVMKFKWIRHEKMLKQTAILIRFWHASIPKCPSTICLFKNPVKTDLMKLNLLCTNTYLVYSWYVLVEFVDGWSMAPVCDSYPWAYRYSSIECVYTG